jgi:hypothetical protein
MDHLGAQAYFCQEIGHLLSGFERLYDHRILRRCRDEFDLSGRMTRPSEITREQSNLSQGGYVAKAMLVGQKLQELNCPMPSLSDMN